MALSVEEGGEIRDRIHNLDLTNPDHRKIYDNAVYHSIKHNETIEGKPVLRVYDDGKEYDTIGYGFNMKAPGARKMWDRVIGDSPSFDDAINKRANITAGQAEDLFKHIRERNLKELKNIYGDTWDKLKGNERLMIEDLYFNGGSGLAGKKTNFYRHMKAYVDTSDPRHLEKALYEVRECSNSERNSPVGKGIQNRRNFQYKVGNSTECIACSKPNDKPLPDDFGVIKAKLNETIIPLKHGDIEENCTRSDRFYIWRSKLDDKVRKDHAANEGKIFDVNNPPAAGNPGEDYNCRCFADFYIPDWVEIVDAPASKHIICKHITDLSEIPGWKQI